MKAFALFVRGALGVLGAFGSAALAPNAAAACSPPIDCPEARYPLNAGTDVPINTKLWTRFDGTLRIGEPGQEPLADGVALEPLVGLDAPLAPNTLYEVTLTPSAEWESICDDVTYVFTTGNGEDAMPGPPALNSVTATYHEPSDSNTCGPTPGRFVIALSLATPLIADAVAHRVYQVDGGQRTLRHERMLPAMPEFTVYASTVDADYEVVAVSASGLESAATPFSVEEDAASGSGDDAGRSGCGAGVGGNGSHHAPSLLLLIIGAAVLTRTARRPVR